MRANLRPSRAEKGALDFAVAGAVAEVGGALIWVPQDVVKQRAQVLGGREGATGPSSLAVARTIVAKEGWQGLMRGYWASVATFAPYVVLYFALYDSGRSAVCRARGRPGDNMAVGPAGNLALAALAAAAAGAVTSPLDVVKTRIQVNMKEGEFVSLRQGLVATVRAEGITGLMRGATARVRRPQRVSLSLSLMSNTVYRSS